MTSCVPPHSSDVIVDDETKQQVSDGIDDDEVKKTISDVVDDDEAKRLVSSMDRLSTFSTPHDNNVVDRIGPILPNIIKFNCNESDVDDYMDSQPGISVIRRMRLIDNLIEAHYDWELTNETLHLTINIVDRFLAVETISSNELVCVGVTSMFIASKYLEVECYSVKYMVKICGKACTEEDIEAMETRILRRLRWKLHVPTPYFFLTWFLKPFENMETIENMVCFYAELGMLNYEIVIKFCPSIVAAAALYATCASSDKSHMWRQILEMQTDLNETQVLECAKMMAEINLVLKDDEERKWFIYKKYSSETQGAMT